MKYQRIVWALLAAGVLLGSLAVSEANARGRRVYVTPAPMYYSYPDVSYSYYYYNPYVLPLPGYGILPPSFSTQDRDASMFRSAADYGHPYDSLAVPAKKRATLFPAVPFEKTPEERVVDLHRARFEITVPFADAEVTFNGLPTKQTGLVRVFVTQALEIGKEYPVTIDARWKKDKDGTMSLPRPRTFTVEANQTVTHTFKEQ